MYAIFDLETTGLHRNDRIVEAAIVHADETGAVTETWHTLVNPQRDLGPVHVHGIRAADARHAPVFSDVAGAIVHMLEGRIPVAHNIGFDASMLTNEFARLQVDIPNVAEYGVCTMAWASEFLSPGGRSLHRCCEAAGIGNDRPHETLSDALATTQLLAHYLAHCSDIQAPWAQLHATALDMVWPAHFESTAPQVHRGAAASVDLLKLFPTQRTATADTDAIQRYVTALDRALVNDRLCASQAEALATLAKASGIGVRCAVDWHSRYLGARAAHERTHRGQPEVRRKIATLASALGLSHDHVDAALHAQAPTLPFEFSPFELSRGDTVVLTGTFSEGKQFWSQHFTDSGLTVADYVTKRTALVIAADPDTMSAKAKLARRYGIPVAVPRCAQQLAATMASALIQQLRRPKFFGRRSCGEPSGAKPECPAIPCRPA